MMLTGALTRQFFVMRHGSKLGRNGHPWPHALVGKIEPLSVTELAG